MHTEGLRQYMPHIGILSVFFFFPWKCGASFLDIIGYLKLIVHIKLTGLYSNAANRCWVLFVVLTHDCLERCCYVNTFLMFALLTTKQSVTFKSKHPALSTLPCSVEVLG